MGADDNTLQVGQTKHVPLNVGSSLMTAQYGAQEFVFSLRLPANVSVTASDPFVANASVPCGSRSYLSSLTR
jgi:hypothetical protein